MVIHVVFVRAISGAVTDDFTTVYSAIRRFLAGEAVYTETYHHVDPHYLYNPGATLLLSPIGFSGNYELSRFFFIVANAIAIILAVALITHLVKAREAFPLFLLLAFCTEAVQNTLIFSNINGILLLIFVGFLWAVITRRSWLAGILLGFAIVIKPMFAPLLVLLVFRLDRKAILGAIIVPVVSNLAAWPLMTQVEDYRNIVMPYLGQVRDYANASLPGFAEYFGMPNALFTVLWLFFAVLVIGGTLILAYWRYSNELVWITTSSALLLTGVFLLSSLGQQYYSMLLFPMIATAVLRTSVMHSAPAWLGVLLVLIPFQWPEGIYWQWASTFIATAG